MDRRGEHDDAQRPGDWLGRLPWIRWLVAFGLALRTYHYLRGPSLWHDEAALVVNVLEKSFAELLGPLWFSEAAPPLFLWLEKAASLLLGDDLYALRLAPFLASCLALVLFVPVARRWLPEAAVPWAVLFFACSDRLLWHACEAKQYSGEVLAAVAILALYCRSEGWPLARRSLALAALAPALLWMAYPGCFLYGGVLLALLGQTRQSRRPVDWAAYAALAAIVFGCFFALLAGPMHAQRDPAIVDCWQDMQQFADWRHPASVPGWMIRSQWELIGYVIDPFGEFLLPLAIVGAVAFWRRKMFAELNLLAVPIALAFGAACFGAYPYGGVRVMAYAAPAIIMLVAAGAASCLAWLESRRRAPAWVLALLLMSPAVAALAHVAVPWQRADCDSAASFVHQHRRNGDRVVANHWEYLYYFRNLGAAFTPLEAFDPERSGRVWLVVTGGAAADREPCLSAFASSPWRVLERREFRRTTVLLVERQRGQSQLDVANRAVANRAAVNRAAVNRAAVIRTAEQ
ncbi:MAG TPA: hypothetical protein VMV10_32525 [Pirellulales bacterium]|nr:hypothetical protein [Pirellulales bacterium]